MKCQMMNVLSSLLAATHAPVPHIGAHPVAQPVRPAVVEARDERAVRPVPAYLTAKAPLSSDSGEPTNPINPINPTSIPDTKGGAD